MAFRAGQILTADRLNAIAAPGMEHIATLNLASQATFRNIPQGFRHLQIRLYGGIDGADTEIAMRLNDDNNTVYNWFRHGQQDGGTNNDAGLIGTGSIRVCFWGNLSSRQHCIIDIHDYSSSHWQGALCRYGAVGVGGLEVGQVMGDRRVSEPVTSVGFFVIGGSNSYSPQSIGSLYAYV